MTAVEYAALLAEAETAFLPEEVNRMTRELKEVGMVAWVHFVFLKLHTHCWYSCLFMIDHQVLLRRRHLAATIVDAFWRVNSPRI